VGPLALNVAGSGGGTVAFEGAAPQVGSVTVDNNGTVDFGPAAGLLTLPSLSLNNGNLTGHTDFVVTGPFAWNGGTVSGPAGSSLTAEGGISLVSGDVLDGRTLTNAANATWSGGTFTITDGGSLNDLAGSTFGTPGNSGSIFLNGGGLSGSGTINANVSNSGQVSPGGAGTPGTLTITGSYTQTSAGSLNVDLGGAGLGSQYDQLAVSGSISLAGALNTALLVGFTPQLSEQFTTIDNRGSNPITGTFNGLLEGATVWAGTYGFVVSYVGGDGNDVVLTATVVNQPPASLSGTVFEDFNNDGEVDFGERGIPGGSIHLTGTDDLGNAVAQCMETDADGAYYFLNLRPGNYYLTETQPSGYTQGINTVGTAGGSLVATDQFFVALGSGVNGLNYNYGERPPAGDSIQHGQTATIGFWNNKNGQNLIKALPVVTNADGSVTSVANWLAVTLPNIFGASAGANNLAGKSNASVAALFQSDFILKGVKLDAQVLATALSVYVTNVTLDSTQVAAQYGFTVSGDGVGTAAVNVGSNGDAFGVADNTVMTVLDLLLATDAQAVNGVLYNGSTTKRNHANNVYSAINQAGDIG
jgi:hypothetical protein